MPVSHLALNVSDIQAATSFYLAALQPLGYRYIGHQGNSVGFGEKDADFFLCQHFSGRPSPTHIAFSATSTLQVRECYAAALNAGGVPSGAPSHRSNDCGCFNAAVEDLDGNTIEFILRQPCYAEHEEALAAPPEHSRVLDWQEDVARSGADETQSIASRVSRTKSRAQTALDLASTASKSFRGSQAPSPDLDRTRTEPIGEGQENGGKAFVGTLLGAAAGAAFAYAMCQSERDNAKDEASFAASVRSRPLSRTLSANNARSRSNYEGKSTVSKKSRRNFSTTESMHSSRYPPRSMPRTMQRMIEPRPYNDDSEIQDVISRYTSSRRPAPSRSKTYDALDHSPAKSHVSGRGTGYAPTRSSTLPAEGQYLLEAPSRSAAPSRHTSRRGSRDEAELARHDSAVSVQSRRSEARRSSTSTTKPSHRDRDQYRDSASKASTVKPTARRPSTYESAANAALPPSRSQSYYSAAEKPPPPAPSQSASYVSAAQIPAPASRSGARSRHAGPAGVISDLETVVPDDSISCVDRSAPKTSVERSSRRGSVSKRSEASTVLRPSKRGGSKHSALTMPVRSKEEHYGKGGKRSLMSFG